ncbi:cell wall-binding repeat-containing protein [Jeotgalibacillus sp. ET6]|uniref:cell wall-binding repeat-containing protein n=1 Tax=Jeotgalibacillus sp. ET6 TaxID=3037260 RepID=UPI0024184F92|nr:cell wall-binding repeat-containing protein [Jeotgalibacillus sp. ET6]MDG5471677.1 cell wall-binding repeat-containing protein [Jeotgalibacillus sp. ET6]
MFKRLFSIGFVMVLLLSSVFQGTVAKAESSLENDGKFKIAIIPDTQVYSNHFPEIYNSQMDWLANHYQEEDIQFAMHVGDLVDGNEIRQWENADRSMNILDDANVPYGVTIGNHDMGGNGANYVDYFGKSRMENKPGYLAHSEDELNSAYTFSAEGREFLVLFLNIDATDEDLAWGQSVLDAHQDKPAIMITHTLIKPDGSQDSVPYVRKTDGNSPQAIFDEFIAENNQIFMTVNGHDHGAFNITRSNNDGLEVNQYLVDYQGGTKGGNGYLRMIEFDFNNDLLSHVTYSPYVDDYMTDRYNEFKEGFEFERRFNNESSTFSPGEIITPIVGGFSSFEERWGERLPSQLTDGSGINGYESQTEVDQNSIHNSSTFKSAKDTMWNSQYLGVSQNGNLEGDKTNVKPIEEREEYLIFDLGQRVNIQNALIWQFGEGSLDQELEKMGAKGIDVYVSSDMTISDAEFTKLTSIELEKHESGQPLAAQIKEINAANAKFIKFVFTSNHGDIRSVGLSEVRFSVAGEELVQQPLDIQPEVPVESDDQVAGTGEEFTIAKTDSATPDGWGHYIGQSITPYQQGIEGTGTIDENAEYALLKEFTVFIFNTDRIPEYLDAYRPSEAPGDSDTLREKKYEFTTGSSETYSYDSLPLSRAHYSEEKSEPYQINNNRTGMKATYVFEEPVKVKMDEEVMMVFNKSTGLRYWQSSHYDGGSSLWTNGASESGNYRLLPFKTDIDFIATLENAEVIEEGSEEEKDRLKGANRYETAAAISAEGWKHGADTVVLARGDAFPDALVGTPLAKSLDAPILLTKTNKIGEETLAEIERLGASKAVLLGGEGAVSAAVKEALVKKGLTVERISGKTRYETAVKVAQKMNAKTSRAFVADGSDFADALSISSYAAENGYPILLTRQSSLSEETYNEVKKYKEAIVIGGRGAVSGKVFGQLPNKLKTRIGGDNRYDTAAHITDYFQLDSDRLAVAAGYDFADALTGSAYAVKTDSLLVLTRKDSLPSETASIIQDREFKRSVILGGSGAVSDEVKAEVEGLIK